LQKIVFLAIYERNYVENRSSPFRTCRLMIKHVFYDMPQQHVQFHS